MSKPYTSSIVIVLAAGTLVGCSDPLWRGDKDLGQRVAAERLRRIEVAPLERLAKPEPAAGESAATPSRDRFAGLASAPLTLEECRASALERNLDLKVQLVGPEIASERVREERAKFEALFTTRALWTDVNAPTASALSSAKQQQGSIEPGVRVPLRTGGTATVSLPMTRTKTNNAFTTLNPSFESDLAFSISQPLLRNAGVEVNETSIRVASYNQQISESQAKLAVINQLAAVDRAYWRLYQARRDLDVRQQQYELADDQLRRAQRQQAAGRVAEIEVVRAQAGVAQRLEAIITAQRTVLEQQRELKRLMNRVDLPVESSALIEPQTPPRPVEYLFDEGARQSLLATAESSRMELLELELRLLADAAQVRLAENQTNPRLDLDASYRLNGLGASAQDSFAVLRGADFATWSVGANLEVPLGNQGAKARLREAVLTRLQRLSSKEARQQTVRQDVLDAVGRLEAGWQSILATRQSTILSTRTLQAEQRQFDVGQSTSTQVLDAATRLAESQLAEIRAIVEYQIAQVELASATGTMLGASGVEWQPLAPDAKGE